MDTYSVGPLVRNIWKPRSKKSADERLVAAVAFVRDELRGGASLRAALSLGSQRHELLSFLRPHLSTGTSLHSALAVACADAPNPTLVRLVNVCALKSRGGGTSALVFEKTLQTLREKDAARREAKSLTAQARMSARAILCLSPGFVALLALTDPASIKTSFSGVGRAAIIAGIFLQLLGTAWMTRIVSAATDPRPAGRVMRLPGLRAIRGLITGDLKPRSRVPLQVSEVSDAMADLCEAGMTTVTALKLVAPTAPGEFGDVLREWLAVSQGEKPWRESLSATTSKLDRSEVSDFVSLIEGSSRSGVPISPDLRSLAVFVSRNEQAALSESVRAASVKVLLPVCFLILPAFVLICLVPLMVSGFTGLGI